MTGAVEALPGDEGLGKRSLWRWEKDEGLDLGLAKKCLQSQGQLQEGSSGQKGFHSQFNALLSLS